MIESEKSGSIRVATVEDDAGFRESLSALLGTAPGYTLIGSYSSGEVALAEPPEQAPHLNNNILAGRV